MNDDLDKAQQILNAHCVELSVYLMAKGHEEANHKYWLVKGTFGEYRNVYESFDGTLWVEMELSWKTRDGRIIPYSKLEDDHLLNVISMLKDAVMLNFIKVVLEESKRMLVAELPDQFYDMHAKHGFEQNINWYDLDYRLVPLLNEARSRNLDLSKFGV